jgi:hypothetical protein
MHSANHAIADQTYANAVHLLSLLGELGIGARLRDNDALDVVVGATDHRLEG